MAQYTAKLFNQIAEIISEEKDKAEQDDYVYGAEGSANSYACAIENIAERIGAVIGESNPRFDMQRYMQACGFE